MAKKIKQFRYYGEGNNGQANAQNQPASIVVNDAVKPVTYMDYLNGNVFARHTISPRNQILFK